MNEAMISIKGMQFFDGEDDCIEFATDGCYTFTEKGAELAYMESELTGLEGTKTVITVQDGRVTMLREGSVNSQMVFQEGKKHYFIYNTPYGNLTLGIDTHSVSSCLTEDGGELKISYTINMDSNMLGKNELIINVKA